ncbi:MAG: exodeoxyribonuclease VII large subunit [Burkholderiales bacterium]|nr:exodeoxyribonuclease VII large subunit [Anaerolineae bacterium]
MLFASEAIPVAELTETIRQVIDMDDRLQDVWVSGEVSNMSHAPSGHWYFTLKDSEAQLRCVMWRSSVERQSITPRNGDAITAHGYISVYPSRGEYQLYADRVRPAGVGDLYAQFERLKAQLEAEGLFAEERKRPLPDFPRIIGVVTSAEAAAFQDVQNVLRRRFPLAEVIFSPSLVQGTEAPAQIVAALQRLNQLTQADVIILCRGGGSIEDLWAFNDERVVRAVVDSRIPIVTGVGHETDFTLVDFASDLRAPTPSAAAELVTPLIDDLRYDVQRSLQDAAAILLGKVFSLRADVIASTRTMGYVSPMSRVHNLRQRIDERSARLLSDQQRRLALLRERLQTRTAALNAANPQAILERGYAIIRSDDGELISSVTSPAAKAGMGITIQLRDGELKGRIENKDTDIS